MSTLYHTDAIILKRTPWGEADSLVSALTSDFGKIRIFAQGVRKHGAKLQGHIEPGARSDISFVVGKNGYRATTAELQDFFPRTRVSLSKIQRRDTMLELLDRNLYEEQTGARDLFILAHETLGAIEAAERRGELVRVMIWFKVRFFALLGLLPARVSREAAHASHLFAFGERTLEDAKEAEGSEEKLEDQLLDLERAIEQHGSFIPSRSRATGAIY